MSEPKQLEGIFDVVDIKAKRHSSGNRLEIKLDVTHTEELHKQAIALLFKQVEIKMTEHEVQPEMFDDDGEEPIDEDEDLFGEDMPEDIPPEPEED